MQTAPSACKQIAVYRPREVETVEPAPFASNRGALISEIPYFFFPDPMFGCQPTAAPFWLGAAAMVLILSFFGFFDSRLPFCSPLAMPLSCGLMGNRFYCV